MNEKKEKLFQAFRQISEGTARRYEGIGLGLTVSKKLIEILGGTISVESADGEGSTFTVIFPCAHEEEHRSGSLEVITSERDMKKNEKGFDKIPAMC